MFGLLRSLTNVANAQHDSSVLFDWYTDATHAERCGQDCAASSSYRKCLAALSTASSQLPEGESSTFESRLLCNSIRSLWKEFDHSKPQAATINKGGAVAGGEAVTLDQVTAAFPATEWLSKASAVSRPRVASSSHKTDDGSGGNKPNNSNSLPAARTAAQATSSARPIVAPAAQARQTATAKHVDAQPTFVSQRVVVPPSVPAPNQAAAVALQRPAVPVQSAPQVAPNQQRPWKLPTLINSSPSEATSVSSALPAAVVNVPVGPTATSTVATCFVSAAQQLDNDIKQGRVNPSFAASLQPKPSLGLRKFTPPFQPQANNGQNGADSAAPAPSVSVGKVLSNTVNPKGSSGNKQQGQGEDNDPANYPASLLLPDGSVPPILLPLDPKLVTQIAYEIMEKQCNVDWTDIAGLDHAKQSVEETIVWPLTRPDIFVGIRDPPKGLLLFGPPGTGKTMIARAIASRANCTFLNISSSSLMSKWVGDGEKMVRCLFAVAVVRQPSVIFIDEIDSLLSMRGEGENDGVRRVKTEFLVQLDGVGTSASDRVLLIGATNRPEELDEAARRRMEKRLYIPLPDSSARRQLIQNLLGKGEFRHSIQDNEFDEVAGLTEGYSGADLKNVCREAAMGPLRSAKSVLSDVAVHDIRAVTVKDFQNAVKRIKPSVGQGELARYIDWNAQYGSFSEAADDESDD